MKSIKRYYELVVLAAFVGMAIFPDGIHFKWWQALKRKVVEKEIGGVKWESWPNLVHLKGNYGYEDNIIPPPPHCLLP